MSKSNPRRIFVAGHRGMVGSAILRLLQSRISGGEALELVVRSRSELDLLSQAAVHDFLRREGIDEIYLAAARVGGIHANDTYPANFIYENLVIEANVIGAAHAAGIQRLLFLGSSCIYPRMAEQPMRESALLTGPLEPTNEPYAIAKIAGIKLCESFNRQFGRDYRSVMPTNLYGPGDNFHSHNSHVIPALIRRFHEAKIAGATEIEVWGSGRPRREFLYVEDMASACLHVMDLPAPEWRQAVEPMLSHINVGTGEDCTIRELADSIARVTGFSGRIVFDPDKPDGAPRKLLDVSRLSSLGWKAATSLEDGLSRTYQWFLTHQDSFRSI